MPNILRRLSRSLSADRKRKNSCTQLNDENLTSAQNGKVIQTESFNNTAKQNGTRKSRASKKIKNYTDDAAAALEKQPEFKERRKFWTRSTSFGKRNRITLQNSSEENQAVVPPNLTVVNQKHEGEKKWFSTNAFQSDAMEESCQKACNNSDNKGESDDLTPSSYVYCDVCGDLCDGETLKPFEKDVWIHQNCFKCAICKKDLDPCLYFERGRKYLCAKDYHISLEASLGVDAIDTGEATLNGYRSNDLVLQKDSFTDNKTEHIQNGRNQSQPLNTDFNPVKEPISSANLTHKDPSIIKQRVTVPPVTSTHPGNSPDRIVSKCSQTYPQTVKRQTASTATMTSVESNTLYKTPNSTPSLPSSSQDNIQETEHYHHHQQQDWSHRMGVCHICEQDLDRSGALLVMGRLIHSDCYICCKCGRQPKVGQDVTIQAKKVICCNGLPERIKTCQGCLKQIFHGELTLSVGGGGEKTWHRMCFRCSKCSMLISEEFHFKDNMQHCLRCYKKYCDVTCLYCGQLILGEGEDSCITTAGNKRYHPKCAFCSVCGGHFKSANDMLTEGDELWHPKCSTLRKSIRQMENFITGAQPKTNSNNEIHSALSPRSTISPWVDKPKDSNSQPTIERRSPPRELSVSGDIPASELKSHLNLPLVEEETETDVASEEAEKCCTQASFVAQDSNKRQITSPAHKPAPPNSLKPLKQSPPTPIPTAQYPFRQPGNRIQSPHQREIGFDPSFAVPNTFLSRLNQAKLDQQIYRGRQARPMYSNRRKMQSSRHVSLEPTIVESELENEAIYENEDMFEKESDIREESESDKSSQEDSRSIGSNASSTDFNFTESKATPKRTTTPITPNSDKFIPYSQLRVRNVKLPSGIDRKNLEMYLSDSEFYSVFKCSKHEFYKLPKWRRDGLKKQFELF
ncbi:uncharacterized protein LOC142334581 isoform X2 [Convolutriloba macropyga]